MPYFNVEPLDINHEVIQDHITELPEMELEVALGLFEDGQILVAITSEKGKYSIYEPRGIKGLAWLQQHRYEIEAYRGRTLWYSLTHDEELSKWRHESHLLNFPPPIETPIDETWGLSPQSYNALKKADLLTVERVFDRERFYTRHHYYLAVNGFGKKSYETLRSKFIERGYADPNSERIVPISDDDSTSSNETLATNEPKTP